MKIKSNHKTLARYCFLPEVYSLFVREREREREREIVKFWRAPNRAFLLVCVELEEN